MNSEICIVFPEGKRVKVEGPACASIFLEYAQSILGCDDFYFIYQGKKLNDTSVVNQGNVYVASRLPGGKGGFGSMLRAIGAQIEKTTNREACRDLSGRRLRDINEEKRLKSWITQQADREREAADRKEKRLQRLMATPKSEFKDPEYEAARSEMTEKVADAVEQGFKAAACTSQSSSKKRPASSTCVSAAKKKKTCLWLDDEVGDLSSSEDTDSEDEATSPVETKASNNKLDEGASTSTAEEQEHEGVVVPA